MPLDLMPKLSDVDGIYQYLVDGFAGADESQTAVISARLILLLANHIGDADVIREAIDAATKYSVASITGT